MRTIGWGVIGLGFFGEKHAEVARALPNVALRGVATRNSQRLHAIADRLAVPGRYADYRQLLADPTIEAVSVVTHVADHAEPTIAALEAGKHVLVEKPLAGTLAQCDAMIAAARRNGRLLMVGHICRFNPRYAVARQRIAAGAIGTIVSMHARRNIPAARSQIVLEKVGPLLGDGIHDTDLMRWFMGAEPQDPSSPASSAASSWGTIESAFAMTHSVRGLRHPDLAWGMYRFAGGAIGVIENVWLLPEGTPFRIHEQFEVIGTEGAIYIQGADLNLTIHSRGQVDCPDTWYWTEMHGEPAGALRAELAHFVDCVAQGRTSSDVVSLEDARHAVAAVLAAEESARTGMPVRPGA